ncbi:MAG: hypothetical protein ACRDRL_05410, partial [Sciscionella sp.]
MLGGGNRVVSACRNLAQGGSGVPERLVSGITHTQYSITGGSPRGVVRAKAVLSRSGTCLQNQYIMGFGVGNPEPSPGVFDFADLDRRIRLIRSTGGIPVLTLCCAPDWMKGGAAGTTDWSKINTAPIPAHYADFARLARTVAQRYPDVTHFQVWSELKGFWRADLDRWDYERYTAFYNLIYDTLKKVNPRIQVGGPYISMDSGSSPAGMSDPSAVNGVWGTLDQR